MNILDKLAVNILITLGLMGYVMPAFSQNICSARRSNEVRTREDLNAWKISEERVAIDIRSPAEFNRGHIQDSLNLPGFSLKHRADLKATSILLIAEPFQFTTTYRIAAELSKRGFIEPFILKYGVYSAKASGLKLSDPKFSLPEIIPVSANLVTTELFRAEPIVVLPENTTTNNLEIAKYGRIFKLSLENRAQHELLKDLAQKHPIISLADTSDSERITVWSKAISKVINDPLHTPEEQTESNLTTTTPVFSLSGGLPAALKHLAEHKSIIEQIRRSKEPKSCR